MTYVDIISVRMCWLGIKAEYSWSDIKLKYLAVLKTRARMVKTITKAAIVELCNEVLATRIPDKFFKVVETNLDMISNHLKTDKNFKREF